MGYTHYWNNATFTDEQWTTLQQAAAMVFATVRAKGIAIAGWDGKGSPTVDDERISFNGREPEDFETCVIKRNSNKFSFCKTGRRPYDTAVVALLMCATRIGPLDWSSDGEGEDHAAGLAVATRVLQRLHRNAA